MYPVTGALGAGAVAGGALATTGFDLLIPVIVAIVLLMAGAVGLRAAVVQVRRPSS